MQIEPSEELKQSVSELIKFALKHHPDGATLSFESIEINDIPLGGWTITIARKK